VKAWAARNGLEIVRKLEVGVNIYVVKTNAGMEALEKAYALYHAGEVQAAFPDWWQEFSLQ
jgi:hypothetical protein